MATSTSCEGLHLRLRGGTEHINLNTAREGMGGAMCGRRSAAGGTTYNSGVWVSWGLLGPLAALVGLVPPTLLAETRAFEQTSLPSALIYPGSPYAVLAASVPTSNLRGGLEVLVMLPRYSPLLAKPTAPLRPRPTAFSSHGAPGVSGVDGDEQQQESGENGVHRSACERGAGG